jgi:RNase P subunit RPR2
MYLILWLLLSILISAIAGSRGDSPGKWLLISLLLSPVIAGILLTIRMLSGEKTRIEWAKCQKCGELNEGHRSYCKKCYYSFVLSRKNLVRVERNKVCPFCAEEIKIEAVKCKHCGSNLRTD